MIMPEMWNSLSDFAKETTAEAICIYYISHNLMHNLLGSVKFINNTDTCSRLIDLVYSRNYNLEAVAILLRRIDELRTDVSKELIL